MRKLFSLAATMIMAMGLGVARGADEPAAAEPPVTLHVGDAAPALDTGKWIKGEPVTKFEPGKIYVVEFWATWCGPCRQSIPHLSELQKQYKDITFIGQDCWEQDQAGVPDFVKSMGDKMDYRVAEDNVQGESKGKMAETWMAAAGQNGIPTAFVIGKDSKILWIGHPAELGPVLKAVVAGNFDAKKLAAEHEARAALEKKLGAALQQRDFDKALPLLDEMAKAQPEMADQISAFKFNILLQKKDYSGASTLGNDLAEKFKDKPEVLDGLAWAIVNPEAGNEKPDLALAEKLAVRANELDKGENASVLETLARVDFAKGDVDKAIELATKAVEKSTDEREKAHIQASLNDFKAAKEKKKGDDAGPK